MNDVVLSENAQNELEKLVAEAQRNSAEAQKFAIEAGKLFSVSANRLAEYKDRGFFKRCWYAISGKTGGLERANQSELIQMQKFAWMYLSKLQEQNLIQARAIAVIRNNLKEVQDEIGDIASQISIIVDKFDARLKKLENGMALHDWLLHLRNRDFCRNGSYLGFLQIVFDCILVMRENGIRFEQANIGEDLKVAMRDFNISVDDKMSVDEFIERLYSDVIKVGLDKFKKIVEIDIDGEPIPSDYILTNFSGIGSNALFAFAQEMSRNENLALQIPDEDARNAIRLAAVKAVLTHGKARYSLPELGQEIVGVCLMAEDAYRAENGNPVEEMLGIGQNEPEEFDVSDLLESYAEITQHQFAQEHSRLEDKHAYVELFAILFAAMGGYQDSEYLNAIARFFGCSDSVEAVKNISSALRTNPRSVNVQSYLKVLNTVSAQYTWALDAMMIGTIGGAINPKVKPAVKTVLCKAFKLPESEVRDFLDKAEQLVVERVVEKVKATISAIDERTSNWIVVARFRGLEIDGGVGTKVISSISDGDAVIVGLDLEKADKVPFLQRNVDGIVSYKGAWFVIENDEHIWKSTDGFDWSLVELGEDVSGGGYRIKISNEILFVWPEVGNGFCYTSDGDSWSAVKFANAEIVSRRHLDFFYRNKSWYLHVYEPQTFSYEKGVIFKTTESSNFDSSVFYSAPVLGAEWGKTDEADIGWTGHHISDASYIGILNDKLLALTNIDSWYSTCRKVQYDQWELYYSNDSGKWCRAETNVRIKVYRSGSRTAAKVAGFTAIGDGVVFTGCENFVLFSQGGMSWKKVYGYRLGAPLTKVGRFYCGFEAANQWTSKEECALVFTEDGVEYHKLQISQRPCLTCFNKEKVFIIDNNDDDGGFFVGTLDVKKA